jgi:cobyrinic acid a,c-diamide synthase
MVARLVIAGTHSGVGKTTLTAGLIAALRQRGLTVQPFKTGPDYIDPTYHSLAAGRPCRSLDTWMVPPGRVRALFTHAVRGADVAIVEGVMGLYDGFSYQDENGSTAQVAKLLNAPVVLVLDASHMARSAAALALGYQQFDLDLPLAGFILNQVGGESHGQGVATAIQRATDRPVLGWLPHDPALEIPERHLGLVPTAEPGRWRGFIEAAADRVARHLDLDWLLTIAQEAQPLNAPNPLAILDNGQFSVARPARTSGAPSRHRLAPQGSQGSSPAPPRPWRDQGEPNGVRAGAGTHVRSQRSGRRPVIAVAQDEAFSFIYPDNLDLLRIAGAEVAFFSPLRDAALPPGAAAVILSGGFPEFYAGQLAANTAMQHALRQVHSQGMPIYAECGGLMYLTQAIIDCPTGVPSGEGQEHLMVGLLPGRSVMSQQLTLGYRLAQAASDSWLLSAGETVRGHEFHYSAWEGRPADIPPAYHLLTPDGQGAPRPEGVCLGNLRASYVHLHFWNKPELAARFVAASHPGA